ncbi:hypothetical protein HZS_3989 [Henneguya salminicola]|nr:hypothetical protein HZS_3989 [Henneguya salminicola]
MVSQWYTLVVFTASLKDYGCAVVNALDPKNMYIGERFYRSHCTKDVGNYTKDIEKISPDLANICIIDNTPSACHMYPGR